MKYQKIALIVLIQHESTGEPSLAKLDECFSHDFLYETEVVSRLIEQFRPTVDNEYSSMAIDEYSLLWSPWLYSGLSQIWQCYNERVRRYFDRLRDR